MENQQNGLSAVVDGLFANAITTFTLDNGKEVTIKRAGIVQIGKATAFFSMLISSAPAERIKALIELISSEQAKLLEEGKSVHDMNLNAIGIIQKGLDTQGLLLPLFASVAEKLPEFCSYFSTVSAEEYAELTLDEQMVIAAGVFAVNYGFFTQSLPPIIKSVIAGLKNKQSETNKSVGKLETKSPATKNP